MELRNSKSVKKTLVSEKYWADLFAILKVRHLSVHSNFFAFLFSVVYLNQRFQTMLVPSLTYDALFNI